MDKMIKTIMHSWFGFTFAFLLLATATYEILAEDERFPLSEEDVIHQVIQLKDHSLLVGGKIGSYGIIKVNEKGVIDHSFYSHWDLKGFNGPLLTMALQDDGKIVVGGDFTNFDTSIIGYVARLNPDGTLDHKFSAKTGVGFNDSVTAIKVLEDGKLIIGGKFTSYNGYDANHVVKLNQDGSLDSGFQAGGGFDAPVNSISVREDGNILIGGEFNTYKGQDRPHLVIIDPQGNFLK